MNRGDRVRDDQWSGFAPAQTLPSSLDVMRARAFAELANHLGRGEAKVYDKVPTMPPAVALLAGELTYWAGRLYTRGAIVHHTVKLGWHQDRYAPADCDNVTTVWRKDCDDGWLVIHSDTLEQPRAHRLAAGDAVLFDGHRWHGVTPYDTVGDRIALTVYVGREERKQMALNERFPVMA